MLADVNLAARVPFHGGNRGSNPLGDANKFKSLVLIRPRLPKIFPKSCRRTAADGSRISSDELKPDHPERGKM